MDAFRLYGRPTQFQWDARNPVSPFFAYPIGPYKDRLFLDRELAEFLDIREERHLANRNNLHGIMAARMRGERTPILPPLPQPNAESTRNLNGPQDKANGSNGSSAGPSAALPPLNFGEKDEPSSGRPPPNSSGDGSLASRGGLDSIGERSREGSVMTTLNTPVTPVGQTGAAEQDVPMDSKQGSLYSQSSGVDQPSTPVAAMGTGAAVVAGAGAAATAARAVNHSQATRSSSMSGRGPGSEGSTMLSYLGPNTSTAASTVDRGPSPAASFKSANQGPPAGLRETSSSTPPPAAAAPSSQIEALPMAIPTTQSQRTLQASGRGAESSEQPSAAKGPVSPITRKVSDPYGSYDEGALYYMNSMADQLPPAPQGAQSGEQNRAATHPEQSGGASQAESMSEHSTAYNHRALPTQSSTSSSRQAVRPASTQVEGIDQDARAAYSFLDQEPSPNAPKKALPDAAVPTIQEAASPGQVPHTYPSTFGGNKRAEERKMAAQAQAQAHQDALTKPGRAGGAQKGLKQVGGQRHAWGEDESEDDDDNEDEDDDEDGSARNRQTLAAAPEQSVPGRYSPNSQAQAAAASVPPQLYSQKHPSRGVSPQVQVPQDAQQAAYPRHSMFNQHLGAGHDDQRAGNQSSSAAFVDTPAARNTFVQLGQEEQPGAMTTAFQPHGLLQAGAQDKAERSAKQQEAQARAEGTHMVNVGSKPPPPQAGLLGAISAHERDRKKEGGLGATLTERERERVQAERRQREEEVMRMQQQQQQMMGGQAPGWGGMPFNPMMWQQMQMMQMMNPHMMMNPMFGGQASGSQLGHGGAGGGGGGSVSPDSFAMQQQQQAQMMAAQAAQQAYMQALSQHGGSVAGGEGSGASMSPPLMASMPPSSMGMMPFNPYMSMYGGGSPLPGFPSWNSAQGSEAGGPRMTPSPSASQTNRVRSQEHLNSSNSTPRR